MVTHWRAKNCMTMLGHHVEHTQLGRACHTGTLYVREMPPPDSSQATSVTMSLSVTLVPPQPNAYGELAG